MQWWVNTYDVTRAATYNFSPYYKPCLWWVTMILKYTSRWTKNEVSNLDNWILFWAYFCVYVLVMIFSIATKRKRMFGNIGSSKVDFSWSQETCRTETMQSKLWRSIALKIALIFRCDPFHHHKLFSRQRSRKFCQVKFKLGSLDNVFFFVVVVALMISVRLRLVSLPGHGCFESDFYFCDDWRMVDILAMILLSLTFLFNEVNEGSCCYSATVREHSK